MMNEARRYFQDVLKLNQPIQPLVLLLQFRNLLQYKLFFGLHVLLYVLKEHMQSLSFGLCVNGDFFLVVEDGGGAGEGNFMALAFFFDGFHSAGGVVESFYEGGEGEVEDLFFAVEVDEVEAFEVAELAHDFPGAVFGDAYFEEVHIL